MKLYNNKTIQNLLLQYSKYDADIYMIPGSLLDNYVIMPQDNIKGAIIKEIYLNTASSAYSIRFFTKISKKIEKIVNCVLNEDYEKADDLLYNK